MRLPRFIRRLFEKRPVLGWWRVTLETADGQRREISVLAYNEIGAGIMAEEAAWFERWPPVKKIISAERTKDFER